MRLVQPSAKGYNDKQTVNVINSQEGEKYVDADPKRTNLKYTDSGMRTVVLRH